MPSVDARATGRLDWLRSQGLGLVCGFGTVLLLAVGSVILAATREGASASVGFDDLRGFLQQLSDQFADADRRHSESLRDMRERLARLGDQTGLLKQNMPKGFEADLERLEAGMVNLAQRIVEAEQQPRGKGALDALAAARVAEAAGREVDAGGMLASSRPAAAGSLVGGAG